VSSIPFLKLPSDENLDKMSEKERKLHEKKKLKILQDQKEMDRLMKMEHMKAIISDAFWYFICKELKSGK
jgi:spore coat polysaccharide biosynthesis predicted glycosyltransferase SpsG